MNREKVKSNAEKKISRRDVEKRYGNNIIDGSGFTYIPNILLLNKGKMKLSDDMLCILLQFLQRYEGLHDTKTKMSSKYLSQRTGKSPRSIQRTLKKLIENNWLSVEDQYHPVQGGYIRSFDLYPAINKINNYAIEYRNSNINKQKTDEDLLEERYSFLEANMKKLE